MLKPDEVKDVIVTHLHYDHCGNHSLFPKARYHLQESEMQYCTGHYMCHNVMRYPFEAEDVVAMVRRLYAGKVQFHDGTQELVNAIQKHLEAKRHSEATVDAVAKAFASARSWAGAARGRSSTWA